MKFIEIPIYTGIGQQDNVLINIDSIAYLKPYSDDTMIILKTQHYGQSNNLTSSMAYDELKEKILNA